MNMLTTISLYLLMLIIVFAAYTLSKKFIFSKVRINKWIPLSIAILLFIAQILIGMSNRYVSTLISIFATLFFLWFIDIIQKGGPKKKENQIVIKPKAKPNRVKKDK